MGIIGLNGQSLTKEYIKIDGFEFDSEAMQNNPLMLLMSVICIDPTEKQKEFLDKLGVTLLDSKNKKVFPKETEVINNS